MALTSTPDNPLPPRPIEEDIRTADGVRLRTVRWAPTSASCRGTVAVFGGRGEFIEKYFEVIRDLLSRDYAVALVDWRGQGGSDRPLRNRWKGHVDDFSHYGLDLEAFAASILAPYCPRPWFGLGHSMGAAVLLIAAETDRCPFERMILTSPMIAIKGVRHLDMTRLLVELLDALGLGGAFVPGNGPRAGRAAAFEGNVLTSDPVRFARIAKVITAAPNLRLGGPTIGWTHAAFRTMKRFAESNFPRSITTPVLIVAAGRDRVTETAAAERFASRLRAGRIIVIEGAEHEILIERDVLRRQFWAAFDQFVREPKIRKDSRAAA
jgi:lysophospholipase